MHTHGSSRALIAAGVAVLASMLSTGALAQEPAQEPDTLAPGSSARPNAFIVQLGGGGAFSRGPKQTVPVGAEESRLGASGTVRLLWRPGHLLGIGVESGVTRISTLESPTSDRTLHLSTVPAMLVFAMQSGAFDATAAGGWQRYIVGTTGRAISSAWEMSYAISVGYTAYRTGGLGIGIEATFASMPERETDYVSVKVRGEYRIEY